MADPVCLYPSPFLISYHIFTLLVHTTRASISYKEKDPPLRACLMVQQGEYIDREAHHRVE